MNEIAADLSNTKSSGSREKKSKRLLRNRSGKKASCRLGIATSSLRSRRLFLKVRKGTKLRASANNKERVKGRLFARLLARFPSLKKSQWEGSPLAGRLSLKIQ